LQKLYWEQEREQGYDSASDHACILQQLEMLPRLHLSAAAVGTGSTRGITAAVVPSLLVCCTHA
jgi:hypothetical protein